MPRVSKVFSIDPVDLENWSAAWMPRRPVDITIQSNRAIGIEVEVENAVNRGRLTTACWQTHPDGSLRNNGTEYVSRPIPASVSPYALHELLVETLDDNQCCFSPRTSIHVHVDFSREDTASVTNAVLLYALFEKLLFRFTGRGRIKNIYCVPLIDTSLLSSMAHPDTVLTIPHQKWSKYSALNILPLSQYGTLEFRHMHGTFDMNKVCVWIRMLTSLCDYACTADSKKLRETLQNLGPESSILGLMGDVFQGDIEFLKYQGYDDVEQGIGKIASAFTSGNTLRELILARDLSAPFYKQGK